MTHTRLGAVDGMSTLRIGSLCTGYGGLDMAVQSVFGGETVWVSDIDKGANKIIAHRYPNIPNLGDFTKTDWATVSPIDILTAGYPCQPFSHAGNRKGTNDARHIWPHVREAVRVLRPRLTLLENVAGHRSLGFDRVLGDLAEDGMHVRWTSLRASDIGAPHQRERLFILVTPDPEHPQLERVGQLPGLRGGHDPRIDVRLPAETGVASSWGDYAPAIARWEQVLGRPAPAPTQLNSKGNPQLAPAFVNWMMGLPDGWVTDVPGITRAEALKALGNGVVPPQAEAATRLLVGAPAVTPPPIDGFLLPTPNPFHAGNTEQPEEWRKRRLDVFQRTGTRHGPALSVVALSVAAGSPLTPDHYMPDEED